MIAEGSVKLISNENPFSKVEINTKETANAIEEGKEPTAIVPSNFRGRQGTLCDSIAKNQIGYIEGVTWLGEECVLLDLPVIYDVIATSKNVRVFRIPKAEMKAKVPGDVLNKLEAAIWPRMNYMRDRLLEIHETRTEIV